MENRTTANTFLNFIDAEGDRHLVSIGSLLYSGHPIDAESGDDMDLANENLLDINGDPV